MKITKIALLLGAAALVPSIASASALEEVVKKGELSCGVSTGIAGFSSTDSKGVWKGLDVDFCQSVAAAVFGDASKVKY
ncbi:MAG: general L-amino acid transport system substrate-binding protein, partial [Psychromonas sp.]